MADLMQWSDVETAWATRALERPEPAFESLAAAVARYRLRPAETAAPDERIRHLAEAAAKECAPGVWQYALDRRVFAHARPDAWPILPGVLCPALVVRGAGSPIMDKQSWLRAATTVQRGQFAEIRGAYHRLILDDPPQFVSVVDRWLAGVR